MKCEQTDRSITLDPLCCLDWMVQTGPAQVHILAVVVGGEQLQQAGQDHVVIIIHVAEPPDTHTHTQVQIKCYADCPYRTIATVYFANLLTLEMAL